jgi:transcriptional regulator with GAF, ATPase, and Fis domain
MVRELLPGRSLQDLIAEKKDLHLVLSALVSAANQVTLVHRAGFFHGDIKPANIIVDDTGRATLVDLGLAAPWQDGKSEARGLTPKYAAPELFQGKPLTPRAEVFAFGATLAEVLETFPQGDVDLQRLTRVVKRATQPLPTDRYPSADEFASDLQRAAALPTTVTFEEASLVWPIVGLEPISNRLVEQVHAMANGSTLLIAGKRGSGRSALLRRLCWALGVSGVELSWIDAAATPTANVSGTEHPPSIRDFLSHELAEHVSLKGVRILVDNAERLDAPSVEVLSNARAQGACLIVVGGGPLSQNTAIFEVPPLTEFVASELVRRAVPSLTAQLSRRLIDLAGGRPGELRRMVGLIAMNPVVREEDIDELLAGLDEVNKGAPQDPLARANYFLERGRYNAATAALASAVDSLDKTIAQARIDVGLGNGAHAIGLLESVAEQIAQRGSDALRAWQLWYGRAAIAVGNNARALELLSKAKSEQDATGLEAMAYEGLALSDSDRAVEQIEVAAGRAEQLGLQRTVALALACLGLVRQRRHESDQALEVYQKAIGAATAANDASTLGTVQLNLAALLWLKGDIAGVMEHYAAAADMGRRSGRLSTVRNALLNLAYADLYLGRVARARSAIETLQAGRNALTPFQQAQLSGLQAMVLLQEGAAEEAARQYQATADAFDALGFGTEAAEALLESALLVGKDDKTDAGSIIAQVERAKRLLGDSGLHQALLMLAQARAASIQGDEKGAREAIAAALSDARNTGKRDWVWRALAARADLEAAGGQPLTAKRDREEALAVLEEIAARLPRDLREVFWNDPRRSDLRRLVEHSIGFAATHLLSPQVFNTSDPGITARSVSQLTSTPLEQRLARILEINHQLLAEFDVEKLTARVTQYAVELLDAECGIVILREDDGTLAIHTSRNRVGDGARAEFSRSIAQQVMSSRSPVVTVNARQDARLNAFASVHQLMLEAVACVPIPARSGIPLGALYLEAHQRPGRLFEREVPMLQAFADQVGLALETTRLVLENRNRAEELGVSNRQLRDAEQRLRELLGERTEKLKAARRRLRDVRETLDARFGYQGMVGTSAAMRRIYALIDRVKDTDVPVLITGESGTGKEVAARAIHRASGRNKAPLLGINCGAIPEHLLESELFGHVRGAFTGADRERKGLIREAEGGAVLLDEIGEMPHKMQAGLLRVLQERKVRPVGGTKEEDVDVRFVFATHRDLEKLVQQGKFREDLYYRIHVVEMRLPSLSERREDIPALVDHFLGIFAARYRRDRKLLAREALRQLTAYDWPGNVRQLEHVLLNAWILSDNEEIQPEDLELPRGSLEAVPGTSSTHELTSSKAVREGHNPETISKHRNSEREKILDALKACSWNRLKAAELSGIPRRTFYRRLREYKIQ